MEAPFDSHTWDGIAGAIFAGFGGSEPFWIGLCYLWAEISTRIHDLG